MPIVQYKNRSARIDSGLPELARLYKGAPRQSESQKQIPPDLDYFRIEASDLPTVTADDITAAWHDLYGQQPRIIRNVQFAVDRLDLAFDAWNEIWGRSRNGAPLLNRRCDGETIIFERAGDQIIREPRACGRDAACLRDCKPTGRLRMFIPELCARLGVLGTVTLITHAGTDIDNISNSLSLAFEQTGRLRNIAFVLYREQVQLMTPAGMPVSKWIVRLELDTVSAQAVALAAGEALSLPSGAPRAIPASVAPAALPASSGDAWDDVPDEPEAAPSDGKFLGVASQLVIKDNGKRTYALKLIGGASISLYGFDALRALGDWWAGMADEWKSADAGVQNIPQLNVFSTGSGFRFEEVDADSVPF